MNRLRGERITGIGHRIKWFLHYEQTPGTTVTFHSAREDLLGTEYIESWDTPYSGNSGSRKVNNRLEHIVASQAILGYSLSMFVHLP